MDRDLKREIIRRISRVTKTAPLGKKQDRRTKRSTTMTVQQLRDLYQPQGCNIYRNEGIARRKEESHKKIATIFEWIAI